jgi:large subunit ribosomal protein L21
MAFAVIHTGGKQYRVEEGSAVSIEKMKGDFKVGDKVTFDKVLLTDDGATTTIGTPYLDGKKVTGETGSQVQFGYYHYHTGC